MLQQVDGSQAVDSVSEEVAETFPDYVRSETIAGKDGDCETVGSLPDWDLKLVESIPPDTDKQISTSSSQSVPSMLSHDHTVPNSTVPRISTLQLKSLSQSLPSVLSHDHILPNSTISHTTSASSCAFTHGTTPDRVSTYLEIPLSGISSMIFPESRISSPSSSQTSLGISDAEMVGELYTFVEIPLSGISSMDFPESRISGLSSLSSSQTNLGRSDAEMPGEMYAFVEIPLSGISSMAFPESWIFSRSSSHGNLAISDTKTAREVSTSVEEIPSSGTSSVAANESGASRVSSSRGNLAMSDTKTVREASTSMDTSVAANGCGVSRILSSSQLHVGICDSETTLDVDVVTSEPFCRICQLTDDNDAVTGVRGVGGDPLVSACRCTGSLQYAHTACLAVSSLSVRRKILASYCLSVCL